ncbi:MAG TPA: Glu/Leu/Phe/Val dehydrogenase dimerization domain-containing protein [Phycisphaerales bacterium]|nr:Glu/Leu/Phe/Val dehydrogenase dimerization domain-containing protein [Phycisphaerales bacterium]HMP37210.1 Glu/Leu/Phe/Val dehydrogenase dimerization domain-containing protein [Phycisphaerales bacterium]
MNLFESISRHGHERVCFHWDPETDLRAIVAIHSTVLGNALGGTRRWCYASEESALRDVLRLSEGMTYKAAAADLPMGGAKSVILLAKPNQPGTEAEGRAMGRFVDTFGGQYIAAEDVGVNTQFVDWMARETQHVMGGETVSVGGDPSPYTSLGCFNGMKACLGHLGKPASFSGLSVAIQGLGATGFKLARLLRAEGATVYGSDVNDASVKRAVDELGVIPVEKDRDILGMKCDILAPCALGGVFSPPVIGTLNCAIICGTSNNVLVDPDSDGTLIKSRGILYAPDFVVNAGGLIRLAGLYLGLTEPQIDRKVADIEETTASVFREGEAMPSMHAAAVALAKRRIDAGRKAKREMASST